MNESEISFGERLKRTRKARGYSQLELSKHLDITEGYISKIEKGERDPGPHVKKAIEHWLETGDLHPDTRQALAADPSMAHLGRPGAAPRLSDPVRIPILGRVPAGIPEAVAEEIEGYISVPATVSASYALRVIGESMEPTIRHGDYVLFVIDRDARPGDIVVVNDEFGESMIKRLKQKGEDYFLVSDNPAYPTYQPNSHYRIMGVVVGGWRELHIR